MSEENVALVKSVHPPSGTNLSALFSENADASGALMRAASLFTEDCEVIGGDMRLGHGLTVSGRGFGGVLAGWRDWLHPWESYTTEVEDYLDAGDEHVVVLVRDRGRLRGSTSEIENVGASVWTVHGGKIARIEFHADRAQALKAVGLEE